MYIDSITLRAFRTFERASIDFVHPDAPALPESARPKLPNMNLVIGSNGSGKTTLLKGIALAALGPAVADSGISPYHLIRRVAGEPAKGGALVEATFTPGAQDDVPERVAQVESRIRIERRGDLERFNWAHRDEKHWHPIYSNRSDAFFFVGYGANRRVERRERVDEAGRRATPFTRARRIMSLFEEAYSLLPLSHWLPRYQLSNPDRFSQVRTLINHLVGPERCHFTGETEDGDGEYVFQQRQTHVPFPALSDGFRAFLGWIGDLLYHMCETCPAEKNLDEYQGIVMIDEADLHIHPGWQMELLPRLARGLPRLQFIVTSHSPLLAGSLEWRNMIVARQEENGASRLERVQGVDVSRMDADQILLTELFGLESTRSGSQTRRIRNLLENARKGDTEAARKLMAELSGVEP